MVGESRPKERLIGCLLEYSTLILLLLATSIGRHCSYQKTEKEKKEGIA